MTIHRAIKSHGPCITCGHEIKAGHVYSITRARESAVIVERIKAGAYGPAFAGWRTVKRHRGCPHPNYGGAGTLGPFPFVNDMPEKRKESE